MTSPPSPSPTVATVSCPSCGAAASGRFCASCGSPLAGALCAGCGSALTPGARFCHRCGTAVGALPLGPAAARGGATADRGALPWAVAAIALLALVALVAGRGFNQRRGSTLDAPLNALPQAGLDDRGAFGAAPGPAAGGLPPDGRAARAPDISSLSPEERASRLFDRVISLDEQGKKDSVQFFAPMALTAYQMLGTLNADQRYDLGRIGAISGAVQLARAQADTILRSNSRHLLGLSLAAAAADLAHDQTARREYQRRLLAAEPSERQKSLPEYAQHRVDIDSAVARARREQ
jgi:hypothetical protein